MVEAAATVYVWFLGGGPGDGHTVALGMDTLWPWGWIHCGPGDGHTVAHATISKDAFNAAFRRRYESCEKCIKRVFMGINVRK